MIKKLSKKLKVTEEEIKNIIIYDYIQKNHIPKKAFKTITLNLNYNTYKYINNISKILKISKDSIICYFINKYIEMEKLKWK